MSILDRLMTPLSDISLPLLVLLVLMFPFWTVAGFHKVPNLNRLQEAETQAAQTEKRKPRHIFMQYMKERASTTEWLVLYTFEMTLVTMSFVVPMDWRHRVAAVYLTIGHKLVMQTLLGTPLFAICTHGIGFGVRGCVLAVVMCGSLLHVVRDAHASQFHFLSLLCFAMAAWNTCGLGSFGGWVAHPEFGQFKTSKRYFLWYVRLFVACAQTTIATTTVTCQQ